jgi:penicillin amidase
VVTLPPVERADGSGTEVEFGDAYDGALSVRPRLARTRAVLKWVAAALVAGVVLLAVFMVWSTRRPFPIIDGELTVAGLQGAVEVIRDADGVPHIYAATTHDLFLALGYVHAQDRFWQMDTWRHIGAGRLAEMFGADQVETDSFLRTMGWERLARDQYDSSTPAARAVLDAYAAGVNAYLDERSPAELSFEYTILEFSNHSYTPSPWTPVDSLVWGKVMAWDLAGNLGDEITRSQLLDVLTPDQVAQLYPPYPEENPVIVGDSAPRVDGPVIDPPPLDVARLLGRTAANAALVDGVAGGSGIGIGSNSWVIGPERSATGSAILANDPHLGIRMPSIWYQVALHCLPRSAACGYEVAGFSFPGLPGVVIGHNDRVAWGFTNLGPDVMDLYVEQLNPADPDQYLYEGKWVDMELRTETVQVAGSDPVEVEIRSTRHGPIISDSYGPLDDFGTEAGIPLPDDYALALRWTALDPSPSLVDAMLRLDSAADFEAVRDALRLFAVPAQNVVYADVDGNIGYQAPGRIPIRDGWTGRLPVPGWTGQYEWSGFVPFDELPSLYNPPEGYIVTANNPVVDGSYPYVLGTDWNYGYRARRIKDLIEGNDSISLDDVGTMQFDNHDPNADLLVPRLVLLDLSDAGPSAVRAREILAEWDRDDTVDSAGAAIFAATWSNLLRLVFHDDVPEELWPAGGGRWFRAVAGLMGTADGWPWDDRTTPEPESRDEMIRRAFLDAVAQLRDRLGDSPDGWEWGELHRAVFRNETLGESGISLIEGRFNRGPYPVSGGSDVVNATGWWADEGYEVTWLPSMRMIVDLGDLDRSRSIHTTGQSGHVYSSHYQDMIERWALGRYLPMRWERASVEPGAEGTLRLLPAPGTTQH